MRVRIQRPGVLILGEHGVDGEWSDDSMKLEDAFRLHATWHATHASQQERCSVDPKGPQIRTRLIFFSKPGLPKVLEPVTRASICTIHTFAFEYSNLEDGDIKQLVHILKKNINVKTVSMGRNLISDLGATDLADALKTNSNLLTLSLDHNEITDSGASALADALGANRTLTILRLDYNHLDTPGLVRIFNSLHHNSTLISLCLNGVSLRSDSANHLSLALAFNSSLRELDLADVGLCAKGSISLAHAITPPSGNTGLRRINVSRNGLGDAAATALASALMPAAARYSPDIAADISADHAASFHGLHGASGLNASLHRGATQPRLTLDGAQSHPGRPTPGVGENVHPGLTDLDLSYNRLTQAAAAALAAALEANRSLRALRLAGNRCGDAGAVALASAARNHPALHTLLFHDNSVGLRATSRAAALLAAAPCLRTVDVVFQLAPVRADPDGDMEARDNGVPVDSRSSAPPLGISDHASVSADRPGSAAAAGHDRRAAGS